MATEPPGPRPGDIFREYTWTYANGDADGSLRVGGRAPSAYSGAEPIALSNRVDLDRAVRAEAWVEKLLCHEATTGLRIRFNGKTWYTFPEARGIPEPQSNYNHLTYPLVEIPLAEIAEGRNQFRLEVDTAHPWNWPQNLVYGVGLRIYHDKDKPHACGSVVAPVEGTELDKETRIVVEAPEETGRVEIVGNCEDVNWEGDGVYRQWHWHTHKGEPMHHIATADRAPWSALWNTSWVPDQEEPIQIMARIIGKGGAVDRLRSPYTGPEGDKYVIEGLARASGVICATEAVGGLTLAKGRGRVELCKPYDIPEKWVTRYGEKSEHFDIAADPAEATAAQMVWCSWSPGYCSGISINGVKVFDTEGPKYAHYAHRVTLDDISMLRKGKNELSVAGSPNDQHGMEINWPGIQMLVKHAAR